MFERMLDAMVIISTLVVGLVALPSLIVLAVLMVVRPNP